MLRRNPFNLQHTIKCRILNTMDHKIQITHYWDKLRSPIMGAGTYNSSHFSYDDCNALNNIRLVDKVEMEGRKRKDQ